MLRTPPPDFSGFHGHKNTQTVDKMMNVANVVSK
jgi:hypothetical protein